MKRGQKAGAPRCADCGKWVSRWQRKCPHCGKELTNEDYAGKRKQKIPSE